MFLVEGELFLEKNVLGDQRSAGLHQGLRSPSNVSAQRQ